MQTSLADFIRDTPEGHEAEAVLRKCVHCGFCNATCPTYLLLGDELDGPRGRIYLIKRVLEGAEPTGRTRLHLDRCLTCRACETTCPSGVRYGRLVEIGREIVARRTRRGVGSSAWRRALRTVFTHRALFEPLLALGRWTRPMLPAALRARIPERPPAPRPWPEARHARRMLVLDGCVQPALSPATNAAAARVLDRLGISLVRAEGAGCCGALAWHLDAHEAARATMRRLIDAWWPHVEQGVEAIVVCASGCGVMLRDYGHALVRDPAYAEKARRVSALIRDVSEVVLAEKHRLASSMAGQPASSDRTRVAFHAPCTLQHGFRQKGAVEPLLAAAGFELTPVADAHLCCGSAGTYSILQPVLSQRLRERKLAALTAGAPAEILTANVGCQAHLQAATPLRVRHWIEALDDRLSASG